VDAVVIATPPTSHAPLGLQAIRAGKHVLIEKPLATTVADAEALVDAAEDAGVVLMVGHTFEYNAAVVMLRELVQGQELGDLYYLDSARLNMGLYQHDVNVVFDLAPHDISIANYVIGTAPTSVQAWGATHVHQSFEDVAYLRLNYDEIGVRANIHVSWLDPQKIRRTTAVGSKKMAVYDDMAAEERIRVFDKAVLVPVDPGGGGAPMNYHNGSITSPVVKFDEPLAVQDRHYVECILSGSKPQSDGLSGLAVVQVIEAAQRSLAADRKVLLEEVTGRPFVSAAGWASNA
jgi:predicted dehydrogenase